MTLSLVDAAGALRDAVAKNDRLQQEIDNLSNKMQQLEVDVMNARKLIADAKQALFEAATADKVTIL